MSQKSSYLSKSFLIWVFANILGISAAAAIPFLFTTLNNPINVVVSVFIYFIPGLAQWLALRRISHPSILWVPTIPAGILLFYLIDRLIPDGWWQNFDDESLVGLTALYFLIGFLIGLLQWFLIQRQFSGSSLWIFGSSIGVGFSLWLILATDLINRSGILSFIVGVLVYSSLTGLILTRLLAHNTQSEINNTLHA